MKFRKKMIHLVALSAITLAGCQMYEKTDSQDPSITASDKQRMDEESYKEIVGQMDKFPLEDIDSIRDGMTATLVYIGNIECPVCRTYAPKIDRELLSQGYDIQHVDLQDKSVEAFADKLTLEYYVQGTPTLLAIGGGQVEHIPVPGPQLRNRVDEAIDKITLITENKE